MARKTCRNCKKHYYTFAHCSYYCCAECKKEYNYKQKIKTLNSIRAKIKLDKDGYLILSVETAKADKFFKLHRLLMEFSVGRKLKPSELVHHKNENKTDNSFSNLMIVSRKEHNKIHGRRLK